MLHFKAKIQQTRFQASVRPSVRSFIRPFVSWHDRRVAATSTRRDGGDRGGRCWCAEAVRVSLSVCSFVRSSLRWSLALTTGRNSNLPLHDTTRQDVRVYNAAANHRAELAQVRRSVDDVIDVVSSNVGQAPAALNFDADTGWDTDCLRLERPRCPKWRTLLFEQGNKNIQSATMLLLQ